MKRLINFLFCYLVFVVLLCGCETAKQETCLEIVDESMTEWSGCGEDDLAVLLFPVEYEIGTDNSTIDRTERIIVDAADRERVLDCFSERERLEMEAFKRLGNKGERTTIVISALSANSDYRAEIVSKLFSLSEDRKNVMIENPYTGNDIVLENVTYVKFKGTPLLLVPPPL